MENQEVKQETVATVGQPQNLAGDLAVVKDLAGGNSVVTVILALVVVLGGGAGWKFWTKRSELKHEQKLKEMELQAEIAKAQAKAESKAKAESLKKKVKTVKKGKK